MVEMLKRGAIVIATCGACALALGAFLLRADAALQPAPASSARSAPAYRSAAYGSAVRDPGSAPEPADPASVDTVRAIDPALFASGACMSFPPTAGDRNETVFLDAGHGGVDPGAVGTTQAGATVAESTVNLAIELDTMALLRAQGYRVVVSRTANTSVTRLTPRDLDGNLLTVQGVFNDVAARDVCANLAKANVLVGIYMNSGEPWDAGSLTGYDADRPFSADNLRLATLLQRDVLGAMNARGWDIPDGGVQNDTGLGSAVGAAAAAYDHLLLLGPAQQGYFETPSQMPGALIEPLFLTDPFEASIAASTRGQQVIATAIAKAIGQYFSGS
jgi:N-acetylmuramoyl-L-alanine amidase